MHILWLIFLISSCSYTLHAEFSVKGITAWVQGLQEETFFKELPFENNGTIVIENSSGTVLIKSWSLPKVVIKALKKAPTNTLNALEIETVTVNNQLSIKTINKTKNGSVEYELIVPRTTNIIIKAQHSTVKTKNIEGIHQITTLNPIDIQGACNSIKATTPATINVSFSSVPSAIAVNLQSFKNCVAITLPHNTNATLHAATTYNTVTCQHCITLKPISTTLTKQTWEHIKKTIDATLGTGGATFDITAYNGITIN